MWLEIVSVIMISSNYPGENNDEAIGIHDGENITGFVFFASLISDRFATFLGKDTRTFQIEFREIQIVSNGQNAVPP